MNTEQRESARVSRHRRLDREDMAVPLAYVLDRPVWEEDLDRSAKEWLALIFGSLVIFIGLFAFVFLIGFTG